MSTRPSNGSMKDRTEKVPFSPVASLTAALLGLLVVQSPAFAQATAPGAPSSPPSSASTPAITDEKLQAFAVAYLEVDKVRREFTGRIGTTSDAATKQKLQNEANQQMIKAVETSPGMSINDYKAIITAAQTDPAVARKVQEKLQTAPKTVD